jgi:coenzyme F420-reducing hydrogenase delta subunit
MAECGEWNRKGATLSDVTAKTEYGVDRDFIIKGIKTGKLEYRDGAIWGNPYLRILRTQLEKYIAEQLGKGYLMKVKSQTELRKIKKEMSELKKRLNVLQDRKADLEESLKKLQTTEQAAPPDRR